jgi:glutamate racemase
VDTVVLGCTHYPLLTGVLSLVLGEGVTLVSSAEETAKDVYRVLAQTDGFRDPELPAPVHRFLATGDPEPFERLGRRFLGPEVGEVRRALDLAATGELPALSGLHAAEPGHPDGRPRERAEA